MFYSLPMSDDIQLLYTIGTMRSRHPHTVISVIASVGRYTKKCLHSILCKYCNSHNSIHCAIVYNLVYPIQTVTLFYHGETEV